MLTTKRLITASLILLTSSAHAIIHYDGDDAGNLTDPGTGAPFYAVARLSGGVGSVLSTTRGSAVYLRGKYLLTANHVSSTTHATFDGTTFWEIDASFTPVQIDETDDTDMKLIKLIEDPGLQAITLQTSSSTGKTGTMIGCGRGRDLSVSDSSSGSTNAWVWPNTDDTVTKRWGTNKIDSTGTENYTYGSNTYSYTSLVTDLDSNAGNNEAAACLYDSGSGIFIEDNGTWKLAGLTTYTANQTANASTFNHFSLSKDKTYFVQISTYAEEIENAIPDTETYSGWQIDHGLYGDDAADTADTDGDGIGQLHEFAFGGDPNVNDISILPTHGLAEEGGSTYLELTLTHPQGLQNIDYKPLTTTDIASWPTDSTGIVDDSPTPTENGDGTETLIYRRSQAVAGTDQAFIRINVIDTSI